MTDDLADLLAKATVRIDVGGELSGTGFVVAPGKVLTCHHVVKRALDRSAGHDLIEVVLDAGRGVTARPVTRPSVDETNDLALLTLDTSSRQPVVSLGGVPRIDDKLYVYGFPPTKPGGTSGTYHYEGPENGPPRLLRIKAGQVQSGFSGAPVLDLKTGTVVAVVRRSRDVDTDLGGLAVPIDAAFGAFERLRVDNLDARRLDPRWDACLTEVQREMLAGLDAAPATTGRRLLVDVGQQDERWTVTISSPSAQDAWHDQTQVDLNVLRLDVARLFRMLKATNRVSHNLQYPVVGGALAKTLWSTTAQERLRAMLAAGGQSLDIELHFGPGVDEDLLYLPWECLQLPAADGGPGVSLGTHERATLVRTLDTEPGDIAPPPADCRISVFRSPDDEGDQQQRVSRSTEAAATAARVLGQVVATPLDETSTATTTALADVVRSGPHVLHLVLRARVDNMRDVVDLDDRPWSTAVSFDSPELAAFVRDRAGADAPRLVVLQPVRVAESELPADLTVFAQDLLEAGVSAVLAFPLPVDPEAGRAFFTELYGQLARGTSVQVAVQHGRRRLEQARRPWSFPVLVTARPGPIVLRRPGEGRADRDGGR
ncbi:trypsin-like peptidase domain-containing protein [Cellulomonas palmilytica]|uniref:trypsin-like peptidase domain-containing protein n=1 Tax=Cellulomonas palmilytica TaxID=2608402 RepID=UPI001F297CC3|nr:trypsin-like peptidase domain-containing protein [Cellulomonas palmilytica]UJP41284.1 trypsin-like peptidase domain-containing protein [Cellulomonas palmilytica]